MSRHPFKTKRQAVQEASKVFIRVQGAEFDAKTTKSEIAELVKHLGGWDRIEVDTHGPPDGFDAYISVEIA